MSIKIARNLDMNCSTLLQQEAIATTCVAGVTSEQSTQGSGSTEKVTTSMNLSCSNSRWWLNMCFLSGVQVNTTTKTMRTCSTQTDITLPVHLPEERQELIVVHTSSPVKASRPALLPPPVSPIPLVGRTDDSLEHTCNSTLNPKDSEPSFGPSSAESSFRWQSLLA